MPARCWTWLPGSQHAPPEYAEVPPRYDVFSTTHTDRPALAARTAPVIAPPPDPTTTTSYCCSVTGRWSQLERVLGKDQALNNTMTNRQAGRSHRGCHCEGLFKDAS